MIAGFIFGLSCVVQSLIENNSYMHIWIAITEYLSSKSFSTLHPIV